MDWIHVLSFFGGLLLLGAAWNLGYGEGRSVGRMEGWNNGIGHAEGRQRTPWRQRKHKPFSS